MALEVQNYTNNTKHPSQMYVYGCLMMLDDIKMR